MYGILNILYGVCFLFGIRGPMRGLRKFLGRSERPGRSDLLGNMLHWPSVHKKLQNLRPIGRNCQQAVEGSSSLGGRGGMEIATVVA